MQGCRRQGHGRHEIGHRVKVYVVSHFIPFEGGDVKAVFSTAEKADAYAKEAAVRNAEDWTDVDVSEEEFLVAEMDVQ
jgi:hypothetical protein